MWADWSMRHTGNLFLGIVPAPVEHDSSTTRLPIIIALHSGPDAAFTEWA